jgi:hypothetical protein
MTKKQQFCFQTSFDSKEALRVCLVALGFSLRRRFHEF